MIWYSVTLPLFLLVALTQTATIHGFSLSGARADVLLVVVAGWAVVRVPKEAMLAAPPSAIVAGLLGASPAGTPLLMILAPVGLALLVHDRPGGDRLTALWLVIGLSTVWALGIELIIDILSGQKGIHLTGIASVLLGEVVLNVLLSTLIYAPLRIARKRGEVHRARLSLS